MPLHSVRRIGQEGKALQIIAAIRGLLSMPPSVERGAWRAPQDDAYVPLANNYGAVWEGKALPASPLDVQITNGAGTTLVAGNAIQGRAQGDIPTTVQFAVTS